MAHLFAILAGAIVLFGLVFALTSIAHAGTFRTRSGRGSQTIPEGYGPRGAVGPSDNDLTAKSPDAVVDGPGRRDAPYQAYPTDASEAFRNAMSQAADMGGGTVYVPPGTYRIDGTVPVPGNVTLHGAGRATHLYTTQNDAVFLPDGDNTRFTQFRLQGPTTVRMVQNGSRGIHATNGHKGCRIDHVELFGFGHFAIGVTEKAEARVDYVYDHHNTQNGLGYGVMVVSGGQVDVSDSEFEQNRHAIASNDAGTAYRCIYCYIHGDDETYRVGALDTHPGMSGHFEIAHNLVENQQTGLSLSDGTGHIHDNLFRNVHRFCSIRAGIHNGNYVEASEVHDTVFADNVLESVAIEYDIRAGRSISIDGQVLELPPGRGDADVVAADDTGRAITDAIASAGSSGGIVFLPPWVYELDAPIRVPANVALMGDEGSTRIVAANDGPAFITGGDNVRLCRLVIARRDTKTGPETSGLVVENGKGVLIDRCRFEGHPQCGILFKSGSGIVEKNTFTDCGEAAVISVGAKVALKENSIEEGLAPMAERS